MSYLELKDGRIDGLAAVTFEHLHDLVEHRLAQRHLLWRIVPRAFRCLQGKLLIGRWCIATQFGFQGQQT